MKRSFLNLLGQNLHYAIIFISPEDVSMKILTKWQRFLPVVTPEGFDGF
jgi:hypothetical protein